MHGEQAREAGLGVEVLCPFHCYGVRMGRRVWRRGERRRDGETVGEKKKVKKQHQGGRKLAHN